MNLHRLRALNGLALAVSLASLAACTTYVGQKTSSDGALPPGSTGIPFVMTRPEYSVDIAPDADDPTKPVYTLKKTDVPDATQRYTIALDPALLVDGTFDVSFGENGNLTDAVATTTSTVVATIQSLVQLSIKSAAAGVAAKDMSSSFAQFLSLVQNSSAAQCASPVKNELSAFANKLIGEAKLEQRDADPHKEREKASALAAARFHYLTEAQRQCLLAVEPKVRADAITARDQAKADYDKSLKSATGIKGGNGATAQLLRNVAKAVTDLSVPTLDKLTGEIKTGSQPIEVSTAAGDAKTFVQASLDAKTAIGLAELFAYMPADVWRARHLQYVERELKAKRFALLLARPPGSTEAAQLRKDIADLEIDRVATLGESTLVSRIAALDDFLAQVRVTRAPGVGERFAADEHVKLREERDKLQARLDQTRTELIAKNKTVNAEAEKAKVETRSNVAVKLVSKSFIDKVALNPAGTFGELPPYVLLLTPTPEPAVRRDPAATSIGARP